MATPIKTTPRLSDSAWKAFSLKLEANKGNKISPERKAEMRALMTKVLANKR